MVYTINTMERTFSKQLWISLGIIIASIIATTVAFYYFSGEIEARVASILRARSDITAQNMSLSLIASLKSNTPQATKYQTAINHLLPTPDNLINFPGMVDTIARSYGLNDKVVFTGDPVPAAAAVPGYAQFTLEADGADVDLRSFLRDIELKTSQFVIEVKSFNFTGSGPASRLSLIGRVFSQ